MICECTRRVSGDANDLATTVWVAPDVGILPYSDISVRVLPHVTTNGKIIILRRTFPFLYSTFHFSPNPPPSPAKHISTVHTVRVKKILLQRHQI